MKIFLFLGLATFILAGLYRFYPRHEVNKPTTRALASLDPMDSHPRCQGLAEATLPPGYKEQGWKTIFEVKYQTLDQRTRRSSARASFKSVDMESYYSEHPPRNIQTADQLEAEAIEVQQFYATNDDQSGQRVELDLFNVRTQLIIDQLSNPEFTIDDDDLMRKIKAYSGSMNDQEYLRFITALAGYVDYDDERAAFAQTPTAGKGIVTPFQQMMGTRAGVCGDIHSMTAKMAEQRGWEAFTVGYALDGVQHVVTAVVDPRHPDQLSVVNYGGYESMPLNDGNSVVPAPSTWGWEEVGIQMRIFKNKKTGSGTGAMQQIATIPTSLGSFMNDLFKRDYQISKAMPKNNQFRREEGGLEHTTHKVILRNNGNKMTDKLRSEGFLIYEGQTDNANIYGIAVRHDVYKDIYRWDEGTQQCVLKKNKYFSAGLAGSGANLTQAEMPGTYYIYLNIKGGEILHLYDSEAFQFKGLLGYEFEAFAAFNSEASTAPLLTADANLVSFLGLVAEYNRKGTKIHTALKYETNIAMRNQNLMTDFSSIPTNIDPISFNAVSLDANISQKIGKNTSLVSNNNFTMTRVGGRVILSTGIVYKNTSIMASYQGGVRPIPIGNTVQQVNLLQNFNNTDGFRLTVGQNFNNKKANLSGNVSAYGGISTSTATPKPFVGGSLNINLNGKKKTKPPVRYNGED